MHDDTQDITDLINKAAAKAKREIKSDPEPELARNIKWPVTCTVGPGLEGAIACDTKIGYVNGSAGHLIYRGYDIFDLCANSSFEEVSYLLLYGSLPSEKQLNSFNKKLVEDRFLPNTQRLMMGFPLEDMNPMSALRLATELMRQRLSWRDSVLATPTVDDFIASDEDSIPMETKPTGESHAIYEFILRKHKKPEGVRASDDATGEKSCIHLISGLATLVASISRIRSGQMPIEPDRELGFAANFLYMLTGKRPTPVEARIMDVSLILHADHGMNASTFASMVVASTLSDVYMSVGAGIGALNGPLHGGANEQVLRMLHEIGSPDAVESWYKKMRKAGRLIPGFGHRVYKAYDPRARVLAPLAKYFIKKEKLADPMYKTARKLEKVVIADLGKKKHIFPNVDFYSGILYSGLNVPAEIFPCLFAVSRVSGWTARIYEYLKKNRIFRPRAMYSGAFNNTYIPIEERPLKK